MKNEKSSLLKAITHFSSFQFLFRIKMTNIKLFLSFAYFSLRS